jgi:hypothetical protein
MFQEAVIWFGKPEIGEADFRRGVNSRNDRLWNVRSSG